MNTGLILFDFDGTLYRGDAPFYFYAERLADRLRTDERDAYLAKVEAYLQGDLPMEANDYWEATVELALPYGLDSQGAMAAFVETRAYMNDAGCPLDVPQELRDFLAEYQGRAILAVASNSPDEAAIPLMRRLDLLKYFDSITTAAGKPAGLKAAVNAAWGGEPPAHRVISVGDHYINEIQPALAQGWGAVHISPRGQFPGPSSFQARNIEAALPFLREWIKEREREGR